MARIIETRSRGGVPTTMAATPQVGVLAPLVPFDPRPRPVNDGGSGQGLDAGGLVGFGGDALGAGVDESIGTARSWFGADALSNVLDWGTELARTLKLVGSVITQIVTPSFWIRVLLFNLSFLAIVVGIVMFARG